MSIERLLRPVNFVESISKRLIGPRRLREGKTFESEAFLAFFVSLWKFAGCVQWRVKCRRILFYFIVALGHLSRGISCLVGKVHLII